MLQNRVSLPTPNSHQLEDFVVRQKTLTTTEGGGGVADTSLNATVGVLKVAPKSVPLPGVDFNKYTFSTPKNTTPRRPVASQTHQYEAGQDKQIA